MGTTYTLCKRLLSIGMNAGLQEKLDTFYAVNRLSMEEYTELTALMTPGAAEQEGVSAE